MIPVAVIIPYFKKRKFIEKTINSIKYQTYKNLEIIISNVLVPQSGRSAAW